MKWYQLAENPQSLGSLYETVPDLENVELFSVNLNREGSRVQIRFDLSDFPDKPSPRWHKDFNTVQIELSFLEVTKFEAKGWQSNMKVRISIRKLENGLEVLIANPEIDLEYKFQSEFLRIVKISPYHQIVS